MILLKTLRFIFYNLEFWKWSQPGWKAWQAGFWINHAANSGWKCIRDQAIYSLRCQIARKYQQFWKYIINTIDLYFHNNHHILIHMLIYLAIFLGQYGRIGLHKRHNRFISHWNICVWRSFNCSEATLCPCGTGWSIQVRVVIFLFWLIFRIISLHTFIIFIV